MAPIGASGNRVWGLRQPNAHADDAPPAHARDLRRRLEPELHLVANARDPTKMGQNDRAYRLGPLVLVHTYADAAQLLEGRARVDVPGVLDVRDGSDACDLDVELIADLSDDLLEQVLHREDPARA